jgi:hypothetical protein
MKVISSFVLLLTAVTVFASDSPPAETHQVLYLADAGPVMLRLSVVVEGEGPKQCLRSWSMPCFVVRGSPDPAQVATAGLLCILEERESAV